MTNREAIEKLQLEIKGVELVLDGNIDLRDSAKDSLKEYASAIKLAITALEKQEPKKPERDKFGHDCCPSCGYCGIYKDEWGGRYIPHCENCGQAIDWEDIVKQEVGQ